MRGWYLDPEAVYVLNRQIREKQAEVDRLDAQLSLEEWPFGPLREVRDGLVKELGMLLAEHPDHRRITRDSKR